MCKSHSVYEIIPARERGHSHCPFSILDKYTNVSGYYVTSGCLVYYNKKFYDPCKASDTACSVRTSITLVQATAQTNLVALQLPDMVHGDRFGIIPTNYADIVETSDSDLPMLTAEFYDKIVLRGMDTGNTAKGKTWANAEGFAGDNTNFCDVAVDWWPESWEKPVGYHVTMPCHSSEGNPRTFDNAFFLDRGDGTDASYLYRMVYMHDTLRDQTLYQVSLEYMFSCVRL
jgi:hypothetical protein